MDELKLGAFSISLAVQDINASLAFYEKLGFSVMGGDAEQGFLIIRNDQTVIGLFQGMFEQNILTFNPGWDQTGEEVAEFTDVRALKTQLQSAGVDTGQAIETDRGPASFMLADPDGNVILIDQHRE